MQNISQPVVKKDHESKITGRAIYVSDYHDDNILTGKFLRSTLAHAKLVSAAILSHWKDIGKRRDSPL